jgi:hypothetical protein
MKDKKLRELLGYTRKHLMYGLCSEKLEKLEQLEERLDKKIRDNVKPENKTYRVSIAAEGCVNYEKVEAEGVVWEGDFVIFLSEDKAVAIFDKTKVLGVMVVGTEK